MISNQATTTPQAAENQAAENQEAGHHEPMSPLSKAHRINLDDRQYGTFAEIGAGQEVARYFFLAGKASHTIAKTISAYDMIFSDEIYGREKNGRYVCESRLNKMLDKEAGLLVKRLASSRGEKTNFFAFANTVTTGTSETPRCRGWMGVRFQTHPQGEFNDVILHVRMMDRQRLQQQESLGILGVNLIYAALYKRQNPTTFILSLVENLKEGQLFIDVLKFRGPDVSAFDNRLVNLELVHRGLSEAILFDPNMELLNISDAVHDKAILLQRGNYRPITSTHLDVLSQGLAHLKKDLQGTNNESREILAMNEMPMLHGALNVSEQDYLHRLKILSSLGLHVLVTQFPFYYQLKSFFRKYTQHPLAFVMGASHLNKIFEEAHYRNLEGGIFEGLGKLLDSNSRLSIYPHKTDQSCLTAKTFTPAKNVMHLYKHFLDIGQIHDISSCDETKNYSHSDDIHALIEKNDPSWESQVPALVSEYVKTHEVFGFKK
jgi:hypothetical protein